MKKNSERRDYAECSWNGWDFWMAIGKAAAVTCLCACFFYRSVWAVLPLSGVGVCYYRMLQQKYTERCRQRLVAEFRECILSVGTALRAGYAVENAFVECRNDMRLLFGEYSLIYQELELIRRGMVINITVEELLKDLADRSHSEEMQQFAEVFVIAKRSGGNFAEIINSSAEIIGRQIEMRQEVQTLLSGRQMEQTVMKLMPFGILIYISMAYPGYFDVLYHNLQGILIMTACLAVYLTAFVMSDRIVKKIV